MTTMCFKGGILILMSQCLIICIHVYGDTAMNVFFCLKVNSFFNYISVQALAVNRFTYFKNSKAITFILLLYDDMSP